MSFYAPTRSTFLSKLPMCFFVISQPYPRKRNRQNRLEQNRFKRFENLFNGRSFRTDKDAETNQRSNACDPNDLFTSVSDPLKDLLEKTAKESKFVINGLSRRLELTSPNRHEETKKLIESLKKTVDPFGTKKETR